MIKTKLKSRLYIKQILIIWGVVFSIALATLVLVSVSISTRDAMQGKMYQDVNNQIRELQKKIIWIDHTPSLSIPDTYDTDNTIYSILDDKSYIIEGEIPDGIDAQSLPASHQTRRMETKKHTYYVRCIRLHEGNLEESNILKNTPDASFHEDRYYLYIFVDSDELYSMYRTVARITSIATLIVVILMIATCVIISNFIARPITRLSDSTKTIIKTRDYSSPLDMSANNNYREIAELSETYNHLLRQVDKTITSQRQFNRDVSHELRTPVTVLRAQCESARKHIHTPEDMAIIEVIERQTIRISTLIGNLLNLSKVEQYGNDMPEEVVSLPDVITSICDDISLVRDRDDLFNLSLNEISITANTDLVLTMIRNLIDNAVRYSPAESSVDIKLYRTSNCVHIDVTDHGVGMEEEEIEHIFESFYRAEGSRSSEGFGLGLTLADRIAGLYEGIIQVQSSPGEGSTFTVILPENIVVHD